MKTSKTLLSFPGRYKGEYLITDGNITRKIIGHANTPNVKIGFWGMVARAESDARFRFWYKTRKTGTGTRLLDWSIDYGFIDKDRKTAKFSSRVKRENWNGKYFLVVRDVKGRIRSKGRWSSKDIL